MLLGLFLLRAGRAYNYTFNNYKKESIKLLSAKRTAIFTVFDPASNTRNMEAILTELVDSNELVIYKFVKTNRTDDIMLLCSFIFGCFYISVYFLILLIFINKHYKLIFF